MDRRTLTLHQQSRTCGSDARTMAAADRRPLGRRSKPQPLAAGCTHGRGPLAQPKPVPPNQSGPDPQRALESPQSMFPGRFHSRHPGTHPSQTLPRIQSPPSLNRSKQKAMDSSPSQNHLDFSMREDSILVCRKSLDCWRKKYAKNSKF